MPHNSVTTERPRGLPANAIASSSQATALPDTAVGQQAEERSRRGAFGLAVGAVVALVAVLAVVGLAQRSSPRPAPEARQLTFNQLRPGDCLTGSNLGLGSGSPWPETVTAVPCTQRHLAEITFTGNVWPLSLAAFPGENAVTDTADNRCQLALYAYAGDSQPWLAYDTIAPGGGSDWASGDRLVVCIAYEPGITLRRSLKATGR